ncbi:hypothetical protein F4813DRAFT_255341 [Daldinia decipiens]|uniref:uncharacterized protein n=1 Tax=Daldinia decipiens TaxID=326647 RepID=UPI0020C32CCD|nr:uncharacterized protein F4813DRAFT_255341 [Daldinia decipiens]KAI1653501.1 hypothetical protein F4813DRAFT_255341 [Daldinia decipiens]
MLNIWKVCDEVLYTISLGFIKLSILRLYGSIFQSWRFHCCLWIFAVLMIAFHLTASIIDIFQYRPVAFSWDLTIGNGTCINYGLLYVLLTRIVNIITDFIIILCAPIPLILRLHTSKQKKRLLIFTFAMGGSACIVSIIRLGFSLAFDATVDPSYDNILVSLLSLIELMAGILATSIPTYRPLFRHMMAMFSPFSIDPPTNINSKGSNVRTSPQISADVSARQLESNCPGINVTRHVELVRYTNMGGNWIRVPDDIYTGWNRGRGTGDYDT